MALQVRALRARKTSGDALSASIPAKATPPSLRVIDEDGDEWSSAIVAVRRNDKWAAHVWRCTRVRDALANG